MDYEKEFDRMSDLHENLTRIVALEVRFALRHRGRGEVSEDERREYHRRLEQVPDLLSAEDLIAYHQYFASQAAPSSVEEAIQTAKEQLLAGARRACSPAAYSVFERMVDEGFTAYAASKAGAGKPTKG